LVTPTVWRGMVVNQSTRMTWPPSAVSRCGMSSQSSRWMDNRCTVTPGRESSAAIRPGSSVSALRDCGHHRPSAAPCRSRASSKLTCGDGGPAGIAARMPAAPPPGCPPYWRCRAGSRSPPLRRRGPGPLPEPTSQQLAIGEVLALLAGAGAGGQLTRGNPAEATTASRTAEACGPRSLSRKPALGEPRRSVTSPPRALLSAPS
jgi:hypothetical protein